MGGLLSIFDDTPPPRRETFSTSLYSNTYSNRRTPQTDFTRRESVSTSNSSYSNANRNITEWERYGASQFRSNQSNLSVSRNADMLWRDISNNNFNRIPLDYDDNDYFVIENLFSKSMKRKADITKIERVQNTFLLGQYLLKKKILQNRNRNSDVPEHLLFHGTRRQNLNSICQDNFDWKMQKRHKFGKGVSFSPIAYYASHYCDKKTSAKVMIVAKVLISRACYNEVENLEIPPMECDTTMKVKGDVIVKYYDDEFYPAFIIHFNKYE